MKNLRAGTRREGDKHVGVLRQGKTVVLECGHTHQNRDQTYPSSGVSARDCIGRVVRGAERIATEDGYAGDYRDSWQRLTRSTGFVVPASVIEQAKQSGQTAAAEYRSKVALVREIEGIEPIPAPEPLRLPLL